MTTGIPLPDRGQFDRFFSHHCQPDPETEALAEACRRALANLQAVESSLDTCIAEKRRAIQEGAVTDIPLLNARLECLPEQIAQATRARVVADIEWLTRVRSLAQTDVEALEVEKQEFDAQRAPLDRRHFQNQARRGGAPIMTMEEEAENRQAIDAMWQEWQPRHQHLYDADFAVRLTISCLGHYEIPHFGEHYIKEGVERLSSRAREQAIEKVRQIR